jgi:poly(3-hydroxybutyrate) depolymerase
MSGSRRGWAPAVRRARRPSRLLLSALLGATIFVGRGPVHLDASVPPGPLDRHPPLGRVARTPTAPVVPTVKPVDGSTEAWDRGVRLTRLGGTTTIQAGQLIYEDWIMDDAGAARQCVVQREDTTAPLVAEAPFDKYYSDDSALGEELIPDADATGLLEQPPGDCLKGEERYGGGIYPAGATPGAADIQELRVAATATELQLYVRLNSMTAADQPVVAIAADTDSNLASGNGAWGLGSLVRTPGADHVITLTRGAVLVDGAQPAGARVASNDGGPAGPANPGGFGGVLMASVPRAAVASTASWRLWAGAGVWDPRTAAWKAPGFLDPSPNVLNLAFRGGNEPLRTWMEHDQAFDLRRGWDGSASVLGARWAQRVNLDDLAAGANETWRVTPGYYDRVFNSHVTDGGFHGGHPSVEVEGISAHQMYGLYVPTGYDPARASRMLLWLHWRGPGDHQATYYVPGMTNELAEQRNSIVVSPRGRGSSAWYVGDSQVDVLDSMDDAGALLNVDQDRVDVAGYSMGGWGTYMMSMMYPDRFASAFATVGPPALGLWPYPASPTQPQNGRPLYWTTPMVHNAAHIPFVIYHGTDDELVPVTSAVAQAQTFQAGKQPYRFFLFPGYEHFSFALADEYLAAQQYMGNRARVHDPANVSYTRLPCLDPAMWNPAYRKVADSAYWVSHVVTRQSPSPAVCTNASSSLAALNVTGTIDTTSHRLPRHVDIGGPVAGVATIPQQSTPAVMTGYQPRDGAALPVENVLDVSLGNVLSATIDAHRAALDACAPLVVNTSSDGAARVALVNAPALTGAAMTLDGAAAGAFGGTLGIPVGRHRFTLSATCPPTSGSGRVGPGGGGPGDGGLPNTSTAGPGWWRQVLDWLTGARL